MDNIREAAREYSKNVIGSSIYQHSSNVALALNLKHPELDYNSRSYIIDIIDKSSTFYNKELPPYEENSNMTMIRI